jgi:hypothetical protein
VLSLETISFQWYGTKIAGGSNGTLCCNVVPFGNKRVIYLAGCCQSSEMMGMYMIIKIPRVGNVPVGSSHNQTVQKWSKILQYHACVECSP